jgi:phosphoenolpyruvate carboxykinase (ATP)
MPVFADLAGRSRNIGAAELYEHVIRRGGGRLTADGALAVETGQHTGRSAADKYIVRDDTTEKSVWWDNSKPMSPSHFETLLSDMKAHISDQAAQQRDVFIQDLHAGADQKHRLRVRVFCEFAWHSLFIRNLLLRPNGQDLAGFEPDLVIVDAPTFKADPVRHGTRSETVIACDFNRRLILIGGTSYAGEIKKAVFTFLNYLLPEQGVLPMHCSVNEGRSGDAAVFFGLSPIRSDP